MNSEFVLKTLVNEFKDKLIISQYDNYDHYTRLNDYFRDRQFGLIILGVEFIWNNYSKQFWVFEGMSNDQVLMKELDVNEDNLLEIVIKVITERLVMNLNKIINGEDALIINCKLHTLMYEEMVDLLYLAKEGYNSESQYNKDRHVLTESKLDSMWNDLPKSNY